MSTSSTKFICFYSYKGGIGRSTTLTNWACWQALHVGKKVLIIDMDFEAPGQHRSGLFDRYPVETMPIAGGFIDLCSDYRQHMQDQKDLPDSEQSSFDWQLSEYICRSSELDSFLGTNKGEVFLLPATKAVDSTYTRKLHELDWDTFFSKYQGYDLTAKLRLYAELEGFSTVFVDARTGLSDPYYIATSWLCDTVVCFSHANRQSVEGCRQAMNFIMQPDFVERYGAKRILPVLNMLPPSRDTDAQRRKEQIQRLEWPEVKSFVASINYDENLALQESLASLKMTNFSDTNLGSSVVALEQALESQDSYYYTPQEMGQKMANNLSFENPFRDLRVEYWTSETIASHYASLYPEVEKELKAFQPSVVFGSRGTGKTTMARYLSYETQLLEFKRSAARAPTPADFPTVGIWLRQDPDEVKAFRADSEEQQSIYNRLFGMYFDILIVREVLTAMDAIDGLDAWLQLSPRQILTSLAQEVGSKEVCVNLEDFDHLLEQQLVDIRAYINNPDLRKIPYRFQSNILIKLLTEQLTAGLNSYFVIYLDEIENYSDFQQRVLNTRVKQVKRSNSITYKLLARNGGLKTDRTEAEGQNLEVTHDYRAFHLDENTDFGTFRDRALEIVKRYIAQVPQFQDHLEPDQLFVRLSPEDEAKALVGRRGSNNLLAYLNKNHKLRPKHKLLDWLANEPSILRQAVAVIMVNQGKDATEVAEHFAANSDKAQQWWHNYARGALFWLCTLYRKDKTYSGFNDIVGVAGNNIRVVIDLCFAVCEEWQRSTGGDPAQLPVSAEIQTKAIHTQSDLYFQRLCNSNVEEDRQRRRVVERLGNLFATIHKSPRQGEPEINHFSPEDYPDPMTNKCLRGCRQENLLRWLPSNKQKSSSEYLPDAYQLNPRYAPHFGISWRIKKKLNLSARDCNVLCTGSDQSWTKTHNLRKV